ncbi:MAG: ATP-binding cassette domain-containing protein [Eubacteriales bacterium]|nr:ATP-binding cassette domain-containing protein [Eubacteriales bacterium]
MIEIKGLTKTYHSSSGDTTAIRDINLTIEDGDIFGIIGLSGAGKSTLVRCINFLERPTAGSVVFGGVELGQLDDAGLRAIRKKMSMIFQSFNLLSQRTALKNVTYPLEISGVKHADAVKRARELLALVGLEDKQNSYPSQLSGGQKQRVAIARALATDPQVLLCDEATSALDPNTTRQVLELLKRINAEMGVTIIIITHEMRVIEQICNKVAVIDQSHIVEQGSVKDIFLSPKSKIARELILPKSEAVSQVSGKTCLRIAFDGNSAFEPVISNLTLECHTAVNILGADTKNIDGRAYGQMIVQLPDDPVSVQRIIEYLKRINISFTEETLHE